MKRRSIFNTFLKWTLYYFGMILLIQWIFIPLITGESINLAVNNQTIFLSGGPDIVENITTPTSCDISGSESYVQFKYENNKDLCRKPVFIDDNWISKCKC